MAPVVAAHHNAIYMHRGLFTRIDALHARRETLGLSAEQRRLLERFHFDFVRAGARLDGDKQARYAQVTERLAELTTRFGQNVLADESGFRLVLRDVQEQKAGVSGPAVVAPLDRAAEARRGLEAADRLKERRANDAAKE